MKKEFTKDDLKTGMIVVLENGNTFIVVKGHKDGGFIDNNVIHYHLKYWNDYLKHYANPEMNIKKVYDSLDCLIRNNWEVMHSVDCRELLWEREEEKVEITMSKVMDIVAEKMNCKPEDLKIVG